MAWIELHQSVWTHKKTIMLAAVLEIDEIYAAAHMAKFWTWALDNVQDGELSNLPDKVIAFGAGWKGDPDAFVNALIDSEWLDKEDSHLYIHDWHDYAGRLIEKKEANKLRMRKARQINKEPNNERAKNVQRTNNARAGATIPNLTLPNQNKEIYAPAREETKTDSDKNHIQSLLTHCNVQEVSIFPLENLLSFVDVVDVEVIEVAIKKAQNKHINYAIKTLKGMIKDGVKTKGDLETKSRASPRRDKPDIPIVTVSKSESVTDEELEAIREKAKKVDQWNSFGLIQEPT